MYLLNALLKRIRRQAARRRFPSHAVRPRPPVLEALEDRMLLSYTYTLLADNGPGSPFSDLSGGSGAPLNNLGTAAFRAQLKSEGEGIFTRAMDGSLGIMAITSDLIAGFPFGPSINDGGTVSFFADLRDGGLALFTGRGQELTRLVDNKPPNSPFSDFPLPQVGTINKDETVAFRAVLTSGTAGLFTVRAHEQPRILYVTGGLFSAFLSTAVIQRNGSNVAFTATLKDTGESGVFVGNGMTTKTITTSGDTYVAFTPATITDAGTAAFRATLSAGGQAVLKGDGGPLTTIADTSGPYASFFGNVVSINNNETVAFAANLQGGGSGIFTGPDPVTDKVIATGDPLDGSTITSFAASPFPARGLNEAGQLTFVANLADGRTAIARADPVLVGSWTAAGLMADARAFSSATFLNDGRLLVAGGFQLPVGGVGRVISGVEIYDPPSATWTPTGSLLTGRAGQAAILLKDGRVLVAGGQERTAQGMPVFLNTAEIYDPATGTWTATGSMAVARNEALLTLLDDGRVFISGATRAHIPLATSAEIYDPATGQWTRTADMSAPRSDHIQLLLHDGRILVAGGYSGGFPGDEYFDAAEIYDPNSDTWTPTASMTMPRGDAEGVLMPDGRVLVTGGLTANFGTIRTNTAEIYDPLTGTWTRTFGGMSDPKVDHTMTLLEDGRILVAGGITSTDLQVTSADLYDPGTDRWTPAGRLLKARGGHWAVALPDGSVLVGGGLNFDPDTFPDHALASTELYLLDDQPLTSNPSMVMAGTVWSVSSEYRSAHPNLRVGDGNGLARPGNAPPSLDRLWDNPVAQVSAQVPASSRSVRNDVHERAFADFEGDWLNDAMVDSAAI